MPRRGGGNGAWVELATDRPATNADLLLPPRPAPRRVRDDPDRSGRHLDRWPDPAGRLITLVLTQCGLRISGALALDFDCLLHDGQGAPYLRYFNTKMRREAAVPIDEELETAIGEQQRRVLAQWPAGTTCLFPRPRANISGNLLLDDGTYRRMLGRWLATCDITRDEHGRPVHPTPHQRRHTFACRLSNRDVPQEVVRVLLDHDSHRMTSHYAKITDQTVRRHWERATKVNVNGERVILDPDGFLGRPNGPRPATAWPPRPWPTAAADCPCRRAAHTPAPA